MDCVRVPLEIGELLSNGRLALPVCFRVSQRYAFRGEHPCFGHKGLELRHVSVTKGSFGRQPRIRVNNGIHSKINNKKLILSSYHK